MQNSIPFFSHRYFIIFVSTLVSFFSLSVILFFCSHFYKFFPFQSAFMFAIALYILFTVLSRNHSPLSSLLSLPTFLVPKPIRRAPFNSGCDHKHGIFPSSLGLFGFFRSWRFRRVCTLAFPFLSFCFLPFRLHFCGCRWLWRCL